MTGYLAELYRLHTFAEAHAEDDPRHEAIAASLAALISRMKARAA
jgi:hypothetical protein